MLRGISHLLLAIVDWLLEGRKQPALDQLGLIQLRQLVYFQPVLWKKTRFPHQLIQEQLFVKRILRILQPRVFLNVGREYSYLLVPGCGSPEGTFVTPVPTLPVIEVNVEAPPAAPAPAAAPMAPIAMTDDIEVSNTSLSILKNMRL